ncbi:uncharacterized protein TRUGW13939_00843 [Talaromyces rugulosus]|uniref:Uncharacterized protein n=1 Tax=Talaromyces rugulosus TaxID=121627 RepID=A0A7H8QKJ6_TALRU|nr:uncharacterized protein TRUGW13939_00843 [Talaromyces rugulosus]QKX53763.1 hypothetical protein TRUGW13939_00843 [Talaromyces rugulosus]
MLTRFASRKLKRHRSASPSPSRQASSAEEGQAQVAEATISQPSTRPTTPRRSAKRVRVSDPGPSTTRAATQGNNTGLTPAISRTTINASDVNPEPATPSRRRRRRGVGPRRSAPLARQGNNNILIDPVLPYSDNNGNAPVNIQFTPLRQRLENRMRRRLFRSGLSDHMNVLEHEDRDFKRDIAQLKQELEERQAVQNIAAAQPDQFDTMVVDDSIMDEDILMSNSPILRLSHPDEPSVQGPIDTATYPVIIEEDVTREATPQEQTAFELQRVSADLEDGQQQKENFFKHWQRLQDTEIGTAICSTLPQVPETPDELMHLGMTIMEFMFQQFYDAMKSLEETRIAISNMGFAGNNVEELLYNMHEAFFSAHRYLESLVPEGTLSDPSNGKATLDDLLTRLKEVAEGFVKVQHDKQILTNDYNSITQQYNDTLRIVQQQTAQIEDLTRGVAATTEQNQSLAQDMLHNRMLVQRLENDIHRKDTALERFKTSLAKYHEENRRYQETIEHLEQTFNTGAEQYEMRIAELETQVIARQEDFRRRYEGQLTVTTRQQDDEQPQAEVHSLEEQITETSEEQDEKLKSFQVQTEQLEKLSQALAETRELAARLERANESLASQIESQAQDFEELCSKYDAVIPEEHKGSIAETQRIVETKFSNWSSEYQRLLPGEAHNAATPQSEPPTPFWRGATDQGTNVLDTPGSVTSDDTDSGLPFPLPGSEATTPSRRHLFSNIRVGRGKDHRNLDSGIGLSSEAGFGQTGPRSPPKRRGGLFG